MSELCCRFGSSQNLFALVTDNKANNVVSSETLSTEMVDHLRRKWYNGIHLRTWMLNVTNPYTARSTFHDARNSSLVLILYQAQTQMHDVTVLWCLHSVPLVFSLTKIEVFTSVPLHCEMCEVHVRGRLDKQAHGHIGLLTVSFGKWTVIFLLYFHFFMPLLLYMFHEQLISLYMY